MYSTNSTYKEQSKMFECNIHEKKTEQHPNDTYPPPPVRAKKKD